jgi:hypothetical protein
MVSFSGRDVVTTSFRLPSHDERGTVPGTWGQDPDRPGDPSGTAALVTSHTTWNGGPAQFEIVEF